MRSTGRLLRSQARLFGTTTVTNASPRLVWSSERIKDFDSDSQERSDLKLGNYSSLIKSNYHDYCKLGLFRNMQIKEQENDVLHEIVPFNLQVIQGILS